MSGSKVLVVNSGSSSLKFQLFNVAKGLSAVAKGVIDQIGDTSASSLRVSAGQDGQSLAGAQEETTKKPISDHKQALNLATEYLSQLDWASNLQQEVVGVRSLGFMYPHAFSSNVHVRKFGNLRQFRIAIAAFCNTFFKKLIMNVYLETYYNYFHGMRSEILRLHWAALHCISASVC